jgi:hypothetical protein
MAYRESFEPVYGFELLDDMHNFFPEIMYDDGLFQDEMTTYMRHRMRTLFPTVYRRQENMYNIYDRVNRRRAFSSWRASRGVPVVPPVPPTPIRVRPPPQWDMSGAPVLETPPLRRTVGVAPRNPFRRAPWPRSQTSVIMTDTAEEIPGLTNGLLGLLTMGLGLGTAEGFQDVEVAPTPAQIGAGSELRESVSADAVCAICQDHGAEGTPWRVLRCSHMYHMACIDMWFANHVACPVCRTDIRNYSTGADNS